MEAPVRADTITKTTSQGHLCKTLTGVLEKLDKFYQIFYLRGDLIGLATIFTTLDAHSVFCVITAQLPSATEFSGWKSAHFLLGDGAVRRLLAVAGPSHGLPFIFQVLYIPNAGSK